MIDVYPDLRAALPALRALALRVEPWVFDIETYDAAEFPSRREVSTNPHHPDFRVRGCAFALGADEGFWVDFGSLDLAPPDALDALATAFGSDAEKGAFNGGFDENGLVYTGWVPTVRNRTRDGMLALVALGDGTHSRLTLTHAVETVLKKRMHWDGADKSRMRDIPIDEVADGAVRDACTTFELCDACDTIADADGHIEWSKLGQRVYAKATKRKTQGSDDAADAAVGDVDPPEAAEVTAPEPVPFDPYL